MDNLKENLTQKAKDVKRASRELAALNAGQKNLALARIADELDQNRASIRSENEKDLSAGEKKGLSKAFIDRLTLTDKRIDQMIGVLLVSALVIIPAASSRLLFRSFGPRTS